MVYVYYTVKFFLKQLKSHIRYIVRGFDTQDRPGCNHGSWRQGAGP